MRDLSLVRMYVRQCLREAGTKAHPRPMDTKTQLNHLRLSAQAALDKSADQSLEKRRDKKDDEPEPPENLLTEPDVAEQDPKREVAAIGVGGGALTSTGAIRGVTTPLGTTSTYPAKKSRKKKRKSTTDVVARAFGGAKPVED